MSAPRHRVAKRRAAAEDVCWRLMLMMAFGGLQLPQSARDYLGEQFEKWVDLAVETGVMQP